MRVGGRNSTTSELAMAPVFILLEGSSSFRDGFVLSKDQCKMRCRQVDEKEENLKILSGVSSLVDLCRIVNKKFCRPKQNGYPKTCVSKFFCTNLVLNA